MLVKEATDGLILKGLCMLCRIVFRGTYVYPLLNERA